MTGLGRYFIPSLFAATAFVSLSVFTRTVAQPGCNADSLSLDVPPLPQPTEIPPPKFDALPSSSPERKMMEEMSVVGWFRGRTFATAVTNQASRFHVEIEVPYINAVKSFTQLLSLLSNSSAWHSDATAVKSNSTLPQSLTLALYLHGEFTTSLHTAVILCEFEVDIAGSLAAIGAIDNANIEQRSADYDRIAQNNARAKQAADDALAIAKSHLAALEQQLQAQTEAVEQAQRQYDREREGCKICSCKKPLSWQCAALVGSGGLSCVIKPACDAAFFRHVEDARALRDAAQSALDEQKKLISSAESCVEEYGRRLAGIEGQKRELGVKADALKRTRDVLDDLRARLLAFSTKLKTTSTFLGSIETKSSGIDFEYFKANVSIITGSLVGPLNDVAAMINAQSPASAPLLQPINETLRLQISSNIDKLKAQQITADTNRNQLVSVLRLFGESS